MKIVKKFRHAKKTKKTKLIVAEGIEDACFLKHLKNLFYKINNNYSIKIKSAYGGSPTNVIEHAIQQLKNYAFDECYVLIDSGQPPY